MDQKYSHLVVEFLLQTGRDDNTTGMRLPDGHHSLNPYIVADDVDQLVEFLVRVFRGEERDRSLRPDGRVEHSDVLIGDSIVMLSEASETYPPRPCVVFAYVDDADATADEAGAAGGTLLMAPADQPWGDRVGGFVDPANNRWWVGTHRPKT